MAKNIEKLAELLGAEIVGRVPKGGVLVGARAAQLARSRRESARQGEEGKANGVANRGASPAEPPVDH